MSIPKNIPDEETIHKHHILPRHMGGTNEPENLISVNVPMHAFLHKLLWEQHGRIEDKMAWQGLSNCMSKQEILSELSKEYSKIGYEKGIGKLGIKDRTLEEIYGTRKAYEIRKKLSKRKNNCGTYKVTYPNGNINIITSLREWCANSFLNYNTVKEQVRKNRPVLDGFKIERIS